jgi:hypothetical protein
MKENKVRYCQKCVLQEGDSTLVFDESGLCSDCKGGYSDAMSARINRLISRFEELTNYSNPKGDRGNYDCTVMLSGGKDSIYMLHLLLNIYKRRPLAFTVVHSYESGSGLHNVEHVIRKLKVPHYFFTPDPDVHRELMTNIFNKDKKEIIALANNHSPEKSPCLVCTFYMMLLTILFSHKMGIPYVVYCADPGQSLNLPESVEDLIEIFTRYCGEELVHKTFGSQLHELINNNPQRLPQIIYPYVKVSYDAEQIIAKLNALGLYNSHPMETHCSLYGLLNYFAIKKFNRCFYAVEVAMEVRKGAVAREDAIKFLEQFKTNTLKIEAEGKASDEVKEEIKNLLRLARSSEAGAEYLCNTFVNLPERAKELGVELETQPASMPGDASTTFFKEGEGDFGF